VSNSRQHNFVNPRVLKFNVGFLLAQSVGFQRVVELDLPRVRLGDDVELDFLRGSLTLSHNTHGVLVRGVLETDIITECVRCLTPTLVPVKLEIDELFSFPPSSDTAYSIQETGILDMVPLLREEAILSMPMNVICRSDCAGLCPQCGKNLNQEQCDCLQDDIDPRLAVLRSWSADPGQD
jgi:uncharacterized metal-binding protein YceD (DUF177 family)